jgi:2-polyprenyl-3-methyl-5-hydroxy-6-metoxy-1,4-benzoquinol methylase
MKEFVPLICPIHHVPLTKLNDTDYSCSSGCKYPIKDSIPRFVPVNNYADSFGLQWNEYKKTQLDSFTKTTISNDRLKRILGGSLEILRGKTILEAGCGAGRFTEILLRERGNVFAADLSTAVEANYENCKSFPNYFVCQADITSLPVRPGTFDIVICIGVIQHTPNPEKTIEALSAYVAPGGLLVIDHYTHGYPETPSRVILRSILLNMNPESSMKFNRVLTNLLWPVHRFLGLRRKNPWIRGSRSIFLYMSPLVDYHDSYPQLDQEQLKMWGMLDTHDTLTDRFKHLRTGQEIREQLIRCGMENIEIKKAGNGIEARALKPLK